MKTNVKAQEITKIADFISSINNLIHGKFILADVKINEVLSKIESSDALFHYIQDKLIGFNFERELRKSEVKNRFNGGVFKLPGDEKSAIALSFCLLVEFDSKKIDFYEFIKQNFPTLDNKGDYNAFSQTILAPLRDSVAKEFGLSKEDNSGILKELEKKVEEEIIEEKLTKEKELQIEDKQELFFDELDKIERHLLEIVNNDAKIKAYKKEEIVYLLKAMIYANKYRDMRLVSAFIISFEHLTKKVKSINFVYNELKEKVLSFYDSKNN